MGMTIVFAVAQISYGSDKSRTKRCVLQVGASEAPPVCRRHPLSSIWCDVQCMLCVRAKQLLLTQSRWAPVCVCVCVWGGGGDGLLYITVTHRDGERHQCCSRLTLIWRHCPQLSPSRRHIHALVSRTFASDQNAAPKLWLKARSCLSLSPSLSCFLSLTSCPYRFSLNRFFTTLPSVRLSPLVPYVCCQITTNEWKRMFSNTKCYSLSICRRTAQTDEREKKCSTSEEDGIYVLISTWVLYICCIIASIILSLIWIPI